MTSLFDSLLATPQRETSGSLAQDRFDFQAHWGITHLLDLHEQGIDYAIAFEFHDDIFVIKYTAGAQKVGFYQVKTKEHGSWCIKEITKQAKGKGGPKPSMIGKLFANKQKFPEYTDHLGFVSNAPADFIGKQHPCKFAEAEKASYTYLMAALKNEFPGIADSADGDLFHFHRTNFTLGGYETFLRGRVSEFIRKSCGDIELGHEAFRLTLLDHCKKRTKHMKNVSSFSELLASKFIRRADLDDWLDNLKMANHRRPSWDGVQSFLQSVAAAELRDIRQQWEKYEADRFKVADVGLHHVRAAIRSATDHYLATNPSASVKEVVFNVAELVIPQVQQIAPYLSQNYIRAGVLYEFQSS